MNFTASFLTHVKKRILDDLGNPIESLHYTSEIYSMRYSPPTIIYDIFTKTSKEPMYTEVYDLKKLEKYGFCILSIPLNTKEAWLPKQKTKFVLAKLTDPNIRFYKKISSNNMGHHHIRILIDEANSRMKVFCDKINPEGQSDWLEI